MKSRVSWRTKRYSDSGWKRKSVVLDMGAQLSGPSHRLVLGLTAPAACRLPLVVRLAAIVWRAILGTPPDVMKCAGADQVRVQVVRGAHRQRFLRGTRLGQADCHEQKQALHIPFPAFSTPFFNLSNLCAMPTPKKAPPKIPSVSARAAQPWQYPFASAARNAAHRRTKTNPALLFHPVISFHATFPRASCTLLIFR